MTLAEIIKIAEAWAQLGWAIQNQAKAVLVEGADYNDQNPNALKEVVQWLNEIAGLDPDGDAGSEAEDWVETLEMHLFFEECFNEPGNREPDYGRE